MNWHQLSVDKTFEATNSSPAGLSATEVEKKLAESGLNELQEKKKLPAWLLFIHQFKDFMVLVLLAAAIISGIVGDITDTVIIVIIVLLNATVGFVQEYRAEKAMDALKKLATPETHVLRDGKNTFIPSQHLVPGDVVMVEAGTVIPADLRLIETHSLRVEESSLTGESVPVDKTSNVIEAADIPLGDRYNLAYRGTQVINGRGTAVVVATGMKTELGKIAGMLQQDETATPLQKRMMDFGKKLSYLILFICLILFGIGLLRGEEPMRMLLVSISLAVAAIPEALPALITIALARGAKRLVKKKSLIRKLPAVETLGSVTFICTDKTGTLTQNKMKVVEVLPSHTPSSFDENIPLLECAMVLNTDVKRSGEDNYIGDPTEIALIQHVDDVHGNDVMASLQEKYPRIAELPFDSERKRMTTIHRYNEGLVAFCKGGAESITGILKDSGDRDDIVNKTNELASNGIRVLAFAYRYLDTMPEPLTISSLENEMDFIGLTGMIDPPREEAKAAITECKTAGIRTVMITGDHKETATAIAKDIGILTPKDLVLTGSELNDMSPDDLDEVVERVRVYARVSPEQKLNIVKSLQRKNHFVAMTGDGVNDAPSLKTANIGIAMGITGTDVSKEAAHMILLDDNFATIIKAVKEGRRIYDNIRKFVKYIMTCNSAEIWTIFLAPLIGLPVPLLPIHILWINLVTDGLPGLALSAEKAEKNIMQRPPRKPSESLFAEGISYHIIWVGLLMAFVTLGTQAWAIHVNDSHWQTMVFTVLSLSQLGHVLAIRSDYEATYKTGLFSNRSLVWALIITFLLQMAVIYLPFANEYFKTEPLTLVELMICLGVAAIVFHAVELEKWFKRRRLKRKSQKTN